MRAPLGGASVEKQIIQTDSAPQAIGPYSQAVRSGELLLLSGQIPLDPRTGALVEGSIEDETRRVMDNLGAVLAAGRLLLRGRTEDNDLPD